MKLYSKQETQSRSPYQASQVKKYVVTQPYVKNHSDMLKFFLSFLLQQNIFKWLPNKFYQLHILHRLRLYLLIYALYCRFDKAELDIRLFNEI